MRTIPSSLIIEKNKTVTGSAWLWLLDILFVGEIEPVRFVKNTEDITYGIYPDDHLYTAMPFSIDVIKDDKSGTIENLVLKFSNVMRILEPYLEELDGGIGGVVTLRLINSDYLNEEPALLRTFEIIATETDANFVTATLGAPNPISRRFPLLIYRASHCNWHFNFTTSVDSVECNYTRGAAIAWQANHVYVIGDRTYKTGNSLMTFRVCEVRVDNKSGATEPVWNESGGKRTLDNNISWVCDIDCTKTLENCQDLGNSVRFGAYPGLGQGGLKIV